jgi:hypothetical protein
MTPTALNANLTFLEGDLNWFEALKASPDAGKWFLRHDCEMGDPGATYDMITVERPFGTEGADFLVMPGKTEGVLMTSRDAGWRDQVAYPSLRDALLTIGPRGEDWGRLPG